MNGYFSEKKPILGFPVHHLNIHIFHRNLIKETI